MSAPLSIHYARTIRAGIQSECVKTLVPSPMAAESRLFVRIMAQGPERGALTAGCAKDTPWVDAITEQWAIRLLAGTRWPMHFVFYLARRGRLQVSAAHEQHAWYLSVQAEQPCTRQWLSDVRQRCEHRLAQQLGQAVYVQVSQGYSG